MKKLVKILTFSAVIALVAFPTFAEGTTTTQEPQKQAVTTITTIDQPSELTANPVELSDIQMEAVEGTHGIKLTNESYTSLILANINAFIARINRSNNTTHVDKINGKYYVMILK